jgi:hypothetical protein
MYRIMKFSRFPTGPGEEKGHLVEQSKRTPQQAPGGGLLQSTIDYI